eukprot:12001262-Alexandrium_andersonii.AAC.1
MILQHSTTWAKSVEADGAMTMAKSAWNAGVVCLRLLQAAMGDPGHTCAPSDASVQFLALSGKFERARHC